jgi:hypothetical protein
MWAVGALLCCVARDRCSAHRTWTQLSIFRARRCAVCVWRCCGLFFPAVGQVVVYADYSVATHKVDPTPSSSLPFTAKAGKRRPILSSRLLCPAALAECGTTSGLSTSNFGVVWWSPRKPSISDCVLVTVGYVDGSLRWQTLDGKKHGVRVQV